MRLVIPTSPSRPEPKSHTDAGIGTVEVIAEKVRSSRTPKFPELTLEMAEELGVSTDAVKRWRRNGLLRAYPYNENQHLYEPVGENGPVKCQGKPLSERQRFSEVLPDLNDEVQHAT